MHIYSSALCLEWDDLSDVFFITEQRFLRLWCSTSTAIITICYLDAWSVANLQSFDACNNYYYWCHCTIFKIWASFISLLLTVKADNQFTPRLEISCSLGESLRSSVRWHSITFIEAIAMMTARAQRTDGDVMSALVSCTENLSRKLSLGVSSCCILTVCSGCLTLKSAM